MRCSTFGTRIVIYPSVCRLFSHSASAKWWNCCSLRLQRKWTMHYSTPSARNVIHPGVCRLMSYCSPAKRWHCCRLRGEWQWAMQYPSFGSRNVIHPNFRWKSSYSASAEWRLGGCLLTWWIWRMQHSAPGWIVAIQIQILGLFVCEVNVIYPIQNSPTFGRTCPEPPRPLAEGMSYTHVPAGGCHTVLVRSDGHAVACGMKLSGCDIPIPEPGRLGTSWQLFDGDNVGSWLVWGPPLPP